MGVFLSIPTYHSVGGVIFISHKVVCGTPLVYNQTPS